MGALRRRGRPPPALAVFRPRPPGGRRRCPHGGSEQLPGNRNGSSPEGPGTTDRRPDWKMCLGSWRLLPAPPPALGEQRPVLNGQRAGRRAWRGRGLQEAGRRASGWRCEWEHRKHTLDLGFGLWAQQAVSPSFQCRGHAPGPGAGLSLPAGGTPGRPGPPDGGLGQLMAAGPRGDRALVVPSP